MKEIFLENVENREDSRGFRVEKKAGRMSLGVEEPGVEEGQPHGKPRGTVAMRDVECLYERDHRHR